MHDRTLIQTSCAGCLSQDSGKHTEKLWQRQYMSINDVSFCRMHTLHLCRLHHFTMRMLPVVSFDGWNTQEAPSCLPLRIVDSRVQLIHVLVTLRCEDPHLQYFTVSHYLCCASVPPLCQDSLFKCHSTTWCTTTTAEAKAAWRRHAAFVSSSIMPQNTTCTLSTCTRGSIQDQSVLVGCPAC